jgi:hypothetical protein
MSIVNDEEKNSLGTLLVGVEIDATCRKNSMKVTKRVKNITAL